MQNKLKSFLSILAIGFFLLLALASDVTSLLDTSTNTTVVVKNCEEKPSVSGSLIVTALALDTLDHPVQGVQGKIFIVHQKVRSDTCVFDVVFSVKNSFVTGPDGRFTYTGPDWIHDNSQDLFRVEIQWGGALGGVYPQPNRQTMVKYYSQSNFSFVAKQKPRL
ncbi:MAG TPA: hypothetical protein VI603_09985 [Saprospiraceae bacterium]|nr:hypothetical protein [Saprospiraceae bacterium]